MGKCLGLQVGPIVLLKLLLMYSFTVYRNMPLDLGDGKRKSMSPDAKRSGMGAGAGSPVNNPLLGGKKAAADLLPAKQSSNGTGGKNNAGKDTKPADQIGSQESDSFYKMYNKEIKVNQDEIPIILAELTDAAFNFI